MGRALLDRYRAAGVEVRGVDLVADPERGVESGDTTRPDDWAHLLEGCDAVAHTAAVVSFEGDERQFWTVNVLGTRRVLAAAAAAGVSRFVHVSSVTAFGFDYPDGVDERWPVRCNGSPYVDTKVAGEQVVLQAHAAGEIACTVVRPGDVYGPRSRPWTLEPVAALREGRNVVPGSGHGTLSPLYIDNLVDALILAVSTPEASGQVITVTDGWGVPTHELFGHYARMLGVGPPRVVPTGIARKAAAAISRAERLRGRHTELNPTSIDYLARTGTYSIDRARRLLGYEPRVDLDTGMARTEEWLRAEGLLDRAR